MSSLSPLSPTNSPRPSKAQASDNLPSLEKDQVSDQLRNLSLCKSLALEEMYLGVLKR